MKKFFLISSFILMSSSALAGTCSDAVEKIFLDEGMQTRPPVLIFQDGDLQEYTIRTNQYGGDAEYHVVMTSDCKLLSSRVLWSE
ncbi:MAG TPA: hypothetical protein VKZ84_01600 [Bacteriovoracaceae bacterium]|nr:hypothetical protein [Bacteriovoracaceae bacterium]